MLYVEAAANDLEDRLARLAVFIVENSYLNAESIRLDGGIRMAPR